MAQFRTTADLVDKVLKRSGETTSGTSDYESDALEYLNKVHQSIITGATVFDMEVDEAWVWARAKHPIILNLEPVYETGGVTLTQGSETGTFSSAPSVSLQGWFLRKDGDETLYKIVKHVASETGFELDSLYLGETVSVGAYKAYKLDYEIVPSYLYITSDNNKIDFWETTSTQLTATLTAGAYTPSALATEVKTQLDVAGDSTYTVTYDSQTRKFTIASNRLGGGLVFVLLGATGTNFAKSALPLLGFDDEDLSNAASQVSPNIVGAVARFVSPFQVYSTSRRASRIEMVDPLSYELEFPLVDVCEGIPTHGCKIQEDNAGRVWVRFNGVPSEKAKVEIPWVPMPRDLKDNAYSVPLVPRKYSDVLEYGAAHFILADKEDTKAAEYATKAAAQLKVMKRDNRGEQRRTSTNFGEITPRSDMVSPSRRLRYGYERED